MKLVVVESPAKAKTINKYLGKDYKVLASYGHIRDLPSKNGSVDPDDDFAMVWEADSKSSKRISEIAAALKEADTLILATDPDRGSLAQAPRPEEGHASRACRLQRDHQECSHDRNGTSPPD